jgi:hypothetical protein
MAREKDILSEERNFLKENPGSLPEGYFASLKSRLSKIPEKDQEDQAPAGIRSFAPYAALVASFVAIFFFGTLILRNTAGTPPESGHAETAMTDTAVAVRSHEEPSYDEASDEEAIEYYLIANGTSAELLAYSAYEQGY